MTGMQAPRNREVTVRLIDGPCAGTFARVVAFGDELYQRLGKREQVWLRYFKNLYRSGEYLWSGEAYTSHEMQHRLGNDTQNTYGWTEGA